MDKENKPYSAHCTFCNHNFIYGDDEITIECGYKGVRCPKCYNWIYHKGIEYIAIPISEYEELKKYKELYTKKFNVDNDGVSFSDNANGVPDGFPILSSNPMNNGFSVIANNSEELVKKLYGRATIW